MSNRDSADSRCSDPSACVLGDRSCGRGGGGTMNDGDWWEDAMIADVEA